MCCCLCWKTKEFAANKPDFITRFTRWIPNRSKSQVTPWGTTDRDPIPILIQLYSCDPEAIQSLSLIRINPNLQAAVRKDLEFFIPQLCSFYLQGHYPNSQQLVDLIVQAASNDFYFSHRIFFFLRSVDLSKVTDPKIAEGQKVAIDNVLKGIYKTI